MLNPLKFEQLWVYMAASPLFCLTVTLVIYQLAHRLYLRSNQLAVLNPVLVSIVLLVGLLKITHTSYAIYFQGAQFIHFLLGPATVAFAIPLWQQRQLIKRLWLPLILGLCAGIFVAIFFAIGIAYLLGANSSNLLSLIPKSVTTPIAMGISEKIGGQPSLTAILVVITGILGAVLAQPLFKLTKLEQNNIKGFAMGVAAHGIGTARAFEISSRAGAFAALGMGLAGVLTAITVPLLMTLFNRL